MSPDFQFWCALGVVLLLFLAFLREWLEPDLAAWTAVGVCLVLGLLPTDKALASFSNSAPVTVACMFLLGVALEKTGFVAWLGHSLSGYAGTSEMAVLTTFSVFACSVSAFLNNTAVVAVLMPVALSLAKTTKLSASKLLIPLSYSAILGGTCTLVGTSTNMVVQGVLKRTHQQELSLFEITPLGLCYAVIGITYLATIGRKLLPDHAQIDEADLPSDDTVLTQYVVADDSPMIGNTVVESLLHGTRAIEIMEVRRRGVPLHERLDLLVIEAGDRLLLAPHDNTTEHNEQLRQAAVRCGLEALETRAHGSVEAVVARDTSLPGQRISDLELRQKFGVRVMAVIRSGERIAKSLGRLELRAGDQLIIAGPTEGMERVIAETELVTVSADDKRPKLSLQALIAASLFGVFIIGTALHDAWPSVFILPPEGVALICVLGLMLTRCLEHKDVYQAVNWHIIFLIIAMLMVGTMLESTGTALRLANNLAGFIKDWSPQMIIAAVYFISMVLTELISNNAVAAILTPIAISIAPQLGMDARPLIIAVLFAASASFATPVGYQTNTFIYGVGGYRFSDFMRVGVPLNLLLWGVATVLIPVFWPVAMR